MNNWMDLKSFGSIQKLSLKKRDFAPLAQNFGILVL